MEQTTSYEATIHAYKSCPIGGCSWITVYHHKAPRRPIQEIQQCSRCGATRATTYHPQPDCPTCG